MVAAHLVDRTRRTIAAGRESLDPWLRSVPRQRPFAYLLLGVWAMGAEDQPIDLLMGNGLLLWIAAIEISALVGHLRADFWQRLLLSALVMPLVRWFLSAFLTVLAAWYTALQSPPRAPFDPTQQSIMSGSSFDPPWFESPTTGEWAMWVIALALALIGLQQLPNRLVAVMQPVLMLLAAVLLCGTNAYALHPH